MKDKYVLAKEASELRRRLGEDEYSYVDVFQLVYKIKELTLVFYPMNDRLSGMCLRGTSDVLIAVNSAMSRGRQRFSVAHELYHYYFNDMDTAICVHDIGTPSIDEKNANIFASFFLAPPAALSSAIKEIKEKKSKLGLSDIVRLEQAFGMSRQAMLIRLIDEGELSHEDAVPMKSNISSHALSLGYDDTLYRPLAENKAKMTYGRYIRHAEDLLDRGLISDGKYEELLLDAFRADLVYGLDEEGELID
ncbi:MAG: ImmA/IrrE family metallo-endopeptidase [Oscillospiraceae bacterium]|nr:ImmA/IrrE family metallo-endopeptidase [Oscillospiraceae bacterium]